MSGEFQFNTFNRKAWRANDRCRQLQAMTQCEQRVGLTPPQNLRAPAHTFLLTGHSTGAAATRERQVGRRRLLLSHVVPAEDSHCSYLFSAGPTISTLGMLTGRLDPT